MSAAGILIVVIVAWFGLGLANGLVAIPISRTRPHLARALGYTSVFVGLISSLGALSGAGGSPISVLPLMTALMPIAAGSAAIALANKRLRSLWTESHWIRCVRCGYDLHGLAEPRCPECGKEFPEEWLAINRTPEPPRSDHPAE